MLLRVLKIVLLGSALGAPTAASAVELGKLTVRSVQGQPIDAEIEIDSGSRAAAGVFTARLAPADAYRGTGLRYSPELNDVRVTVARRPDGRQVVMLSGEQPVNLPYIDMVVQLKTSTGQVSRAYTFLLEPGAQASLPSGLVEVPTLRQPPGTQLVTPLVTPAAPAAAVSAVPTPALSAALTAYQVKLGDTLGGIARAYRPQSVTLSQMLVALFRANDDAFIDHNMNLVRKGSILTIPDARDASAVSDDDARNIVRAQQADFEALRARSAQGGGEPARGPRGDQVRLARSDSAARADDIAAQKLELKDMNRRVAEGEKQLNDMRRLVKLKSALLARLEEQAKVTNRTTAPERSTRIAADGGSVAVAEFKKSHPCPVHGARKSCSGYAVVHIVPICAGGADVPTNMQWLTVKAAIRKERADRERCRQG
jgi:pilus assembly protein FimV